MKRKFPKLATLVAAVAGAVALVALPGSAAASDGNHDKIPDRWERQHHLSLDVNQARRDQDRDGLPNRGEFQAGDNPRDRDSDDDGVMDGSENAGTISSFDSSTGRLTISLFGGDTLAGRVTTETQIKCEGVDDRLLSHGSEPGDDNGGSGSEPGDDNGGGSGGNSGPGSENSGSGSENSGRGSEPGDDNGAHPEPGDDHGVHPEPGDDHGVHPEPGDDHGGHGQEPGDDHGGEAPHGANCTTAALVPGAVVQEAELRASNGVATFEEVELAHTR